MTVLVSFGYAHLAGRQVPPADRVEDVRDRIPIPGATRDILDRDGFHPRVQEAVLATPGVKGLVENLVAYTRICPAPLTIAIGCSSGRHRAPAVVEILARRLQDLGEQVDVEHLHAHLPRALKHQNS